jgi:hypothetical protein
MNKRDRDRGRNYEQWRQERRQHQQEARRDKAGLFTLRATYPGGAVSYRLVRGSERANELADELVAAGAYVSIMRGDRVPEGEGNVPGDGHEDAGRRDGGGV